MVFKKKKEEEREVWIKVYDETGGYKFLNPKVADLRNHKMVASEAGYQTWKPIRPKQQKDEVKAESDDALPEFLEEQEEVKPDNTKVEVVPVRNIDMSLNAIAEAVIVIAQDIREIKEKGLKFQR